jgi:NtrC-family two-component system response regulator AlgB
LRDRIEDVEALAERFALFFARGVGRAPLPMSDDFRAALLRHAWPGNVRELRNAIERAVILRRGDVLDASCLPRRVTGFADSPSGVRVGGDWTLQQVDDEHVRRVVARTETLDEAARILGIDPSTLWRRRRRLADDA